MSYNTNNTIFEIQALTLSFCFLKLLFNNKRMILSAQVNTVQAFSVYSYSTF